MRKCPGLWLLLVLVILVTAFINPLRNMMWGDDWAYGLTVRHLLTTGQYQLNDWAAANMPVQIYWAAFLARLFGYSFAVFRFSTLILLIVGLIALYHLLRDFGVRDREASLLTFALFSSPAVLFLSFTFQTDVQFLGWQLLALWLYTRGLRQQSYGYMALGAVAALAAVGTRQFGAGLVAGLIATWIIFDRDRIRKAPLYFVAVVPPLLMSIWQFSFGVNRPTFSQKVRLAEQLAYMHYLPRFVADILWRPTVILQYVGLYLLPLLPLLLLVLVQRNRNSKDSFRINKHCAFSRSLLWLLCGWSFYLAIGCLFGYFYYLPRALMPYLAWLLPNTQTSNFSFKRHLGLTLLTCAFAVVLGALLSRRHFDKRNFRLISTEEWLVALSGLALLGLQLLYAQFYDVYLIQFVPFTLFAAGIMAGRWPRWATAVTGGLCLVMLCISSLWTRGALSQTEAMWQAAELAHSAGAKPDEIGGNMTWSCYHGAFDEWVAEIGGPNAIDKFIGANRMHFAFFDFLNQRFAHTKYLVTSSTQNNGPINAQLLTRVPFRDGWLHTRSVDLIERERQP